MKKALIAIVVLGLIGGGGYGVYHYFFEKTDTQKRVSSTSEDAVYVDQVSVITGYGSGSGYLQRYGGEVEPQETLEVKLESERTVKECFVEEGDDVKEGQRLFVYDTQEDEDKLAQAEIDIEKAKGEIELAEKQIKSYEKSKASASADDQLTYTTYIMEQQTVIKQSEYEIKTKELEVKNLKERIADATVLCEMDGVVQKISDPSDNQSMGYYGYGSSDSSAYITILSAGDFRIKGSVNEHNLEDLQNLYNMGVRIVVTSRVDSTQKWYGTISEIKTDQAEDDTNGGRVYYDYGGADSSNYSFYVELESSEGLILGQHVYMEEDAGQDEKKDGLWLEEYYLMQEDGKAYVWLANSKDVLEKHEVTLGDYDDALMEYEITEGLGAEDYIAVPQEGVEEGNPVIYNDMTANAEDLSFDDGMAPEGMDLEGGMSGEDMGFEEDLSGEDMGLDGMSDGDMGLEDGMSGEDMSFEGDLSGGDTGFEGDLSGEDVGSVDWLSEDDYLDLDTEAGMDSDVYDADADGND